MFICKRCGNVAPNRTPQSMVVVKTRETSYPFRRDANSRKVGGKIEKTHDKGGAGYETVKAEAVCVNCVKEENNE